MTHTVDLKKFGQQLGTRELAARIRSDILARLQQSETENRIVFDLEGVESLSSGFCHELFGGLFKSFGAIFPKLVSFRFGNNPNKDFLRLMINKGLEPVAAQFKSIK